MPKKIKPKKLIRAFVFLGLMLFFSLYTLSPRLRQHIAFNFNQLEVLTKLSGQDRIHLKPERTFTNVDKSNASINKMAIDQLLNQEGLGSQRLIYSYHEHLNINYKSFIFLGKNLNTKLPDPGRPLNQAVLSKTHNFYNFGLGGIQLYPSFLINFESIQELNEYLRSLRKKYAVFKNIEIEGEKYLIEISPFFFIDWYWYPVGINSRVVLGYDDVNLTNIQEKIIHSEVNGVFGPNIDFQPSLERDYSEILKFTKSLTSNGKIAFAKHFGYRNKYKESVNGLGLDPHYNRIRIATPKDKFNNEDLKIYNRLMTDVDNKYLGLMIGHHILAPIDSLNMANSSILVDQLARETLRGLTISDAIGMFGFLKSGNFSDLAVELKTDLILLNYFDFDKMKAFKEIITNNENFSSPELMGRILKMKSEMGLLKIYRYD